MNNQNETGNQNYQNNQNSQNYANNQQSQATPVRETAPSPSVPTGAPVSSSPEPKKKSKKPLIIAIVAVIVAAGLAVGGYCIYNGMQKGEEEKTEEKAETGAGVKKEAVKVEKENLKEKKVEELSAIEFYPDKEVSKKDLEEFAELIEERVQVLGDTYQIEADDEKISLVIEKTLLGTSAAERTHTMELLMSRGNVNFGEDEYTSYDSVTKDNISEIKVTEFDRVDILSDYRADMVSERYDQLDKMSSDTIYGLEVTLSTEGKNKMEEMSNKSYSDGKMTVIHDYLDGYVSTDSKHFFGSVLAKDESDLSTLYIVSPGATYEKNAEVMKKILEQDSVDFGLVMQIVDEPVWETDGKKMGTNQVEKIEGEAVIAEFTPDRFTKSNNSEVEFAEYENIIKERMDILGIDYMFGTSGFDDKTYCVKVNPENFAPDFFRMVFGQRSFSVCSSFDQISTFAEPEVVEENGQLKLRVRSYNDLATILGQYNVPGNTVYLVVNDVTVATADITQLMTVQEEYSTKYYLDFTNFLCFGDVAVSAEEKSFLDMMASIYSGDSVWMQGSFRFRSFDESGKEIECVMDEIDWKYSTLSQEDKRVFEIINNMGYDVQKMVDKRNMIVITLDVPVNDELPVKFNEKVKEIYNACGFDGGAYNEVYFVIKDETKESPADQFRMVASKDMYDGKMVIRDYVSGPKFSKYWTEVYTSMETDQFFVERDW